MPPRWLVVAATFHQGGVPKHLAQQVVVALRDERWLYGRTTRDPPGRVALFVGRPDWGTWKPPKPGLPHPPPRGHSGPWSWATSELPPQPTCRWVASATHITVDPANLPWGFERVTPVLYDELCDYCFDDVASYAAHLGSDFHHRMEADTWGFAQLVLDENNALYSMDHRSLQWTRVTHQNWLAVRNVTFRQWAVWWGSHPSGVLCRQPSQVWANLKKLAEDYSSTVEYYSRTQPWSYLGGATTVESDSESEHSYRAPREASAHFERVD